jgi:predicted site-specific integrase-resolvase
MSNNILKSNYVSGKIAKQIIGCSDNTLRTWADSGKINVIRSKNNSKRFYDVSSFISNESSSLENIIIKKQICYCRVSSKHQKDDLERQINFMQQKYPNAIIIKDIGSGINWKRKGLISMLQQVKNNQVGEIIIAHRDRLCRFAFELFEQIFGLYKVKLMVLDSGESEPNSQNELCEDILSIMQIYACRKMGKRRYTNVNK